MITQNKTEDFPIIYLRYLNNELMYIGETSSFLKGRHAREDSIAGNYDVIKILKAPKKIKRRRYWEAYLIVKLKPFMQLSNKCFTQYKNKFDRANGRENRKYYNYKVRRNDPINEETKKQYLWTAYDHLKKFKYFISIAKK